MYIDSNVKQKRESPFLLGLLTSMYAFGPALGFMLSSILNGVYTSLGDGEKKSNGNIIYLFLQLRITLVHMTNTGLVLGGLGFWFVDLRI